MSFGPKRIVLLVKSEQSDSDIVKAFLRYVNQSEDEYEQNFHYVHLDPDRDGSARWSHIILDMSASINPNADLKAIPHAIYKMQVNEDGL